MKLWFRLTIVCWVLLCLFLSFPQAVGLNHSLPIVGSRGSIEGENPPPARPRFRLSEA